MGVLSNRCGPNAVLPYAEYGLRLCKGMEALIGDRPTNRGTVLAVMVVAAAALTIRLYSLDVESLWFDELSQVAVYPLPLPYVVTEAAEYCQPPFDYLIGAGLHRLGLADSDWWVRFPAACFGAGSVLLLGLCVARITSGPAGIAAAILLALCPLHVVMSQEVRPYTIFFFFALASVIAYAIAHRRNTLFAWVGFGVVVLGLLMTRWVGPHFITGGIVAYAVATWFASRRRDAESEQSKERHRLAATLGAVVTAYAIYGPIFGVILYRARAAVGSVNANWLAQFSDQLAEAYRAVFHGYSTETLYRGLEGPAWVCALGSILAAIGLVVLIAQARRQRDVLGGCFLAAIVPFPILYACVYVSLTPIRGKPQYLLLMAAPVLACIAIAADAVRRRLHRRAALVAAGVFLVIVVAVGAPMALSTFDLLQSPNKRDWRGVMTHLRDNAKRDDAFAVVAADTVPSSFDPAVGGQMRYERRGLRFLKIDLDTKVSSINEAPWTRADATVWIVGFNDRMYEGRDQIPTPIRETTDLRIHRFHGLFLLELSGDVPAADRLMDGLAMITDNLPNGQSVVAPSLFRGRYLLSRGDRIAAHACFDAARRQCRNDREVQTLIDQHLPSESRSGIVAASALGRQTN